MDAGHAAGRDLVMQSVASEHARNWRAAHLLLRLEYTTGDMDA